MSELTNAEKLKIAETNCEIFTKIRPILKKYTDKQIDNFAMGFVKACVGSMDNIDDLDALVPKIVDAVNNAALEARAKLGLAGDTRRHGRVYDEGCTTGNDNNVLKLVKDEYITGLLSTLLEDANEIEALVVGVAYTDVTMQVYRNGISFPQYAALSKLIDHDLNTTMDNVYYSEY
jgi:hypothetical protein